MKIASILDMFHFLRICIFPLLFITIPLWANFDFDKWTSFILQGNNAFREGNYELAETFYNMALLSTPNTPMAHPHFLTVLTNLGTLYYLQNLFEEADSLIDSAEKIRSQYLPPRIPFPRPERALINMHSHSDRSDGTLFWRDLYLLALQAGLKGIVITDHNVLPLTAMLAEADRLGLKTLLGMELMTTCRAQIEQYTRMSGNPKNLFAIQEILVYGVDPNNELFKKLSERHLEGRKLVLRELSRLVNMHRTSEIIGLEHTNLLIETDPEIIFNTPLALMGPGRILQELIDAEIWVDFDFDKYLIRIPKIYFADGAIMIQILNMYKHLSDNPQWGVNELKRFIQPLQVEAFRVLPDDPFYGLDTINGLELAQQIGLFFSHAHLFGGPRKNMAPFYDKVLIPGETKAGLDAIELDYPEHTDTHRDIIQGWGTRHNLLFTGGSDFHSPGQAAPPLTGFGVTEDEFDQIQSIIDERREKQTQCQLVFE